MSTEQLDQDLPEQTRVRLDKAARLRDLGIDPYTPRAERTHQIADLAALLPPVAAAGDGDGGGTTPPATPSADEPEEPVTIVGRLVSRRDMGKNASFGNLRDGSGTFQLYLRRDNLGDEP